MEMNTRQFIQALNFLFHKGGKIKGMYHLIKK